MARLGYIAKGIVYAIVGVLAVQAAFTAGGRTTDTKGALHTIAAQPFGQFLLLLMAFLFQIFLLLTLKQACVFLPIQFSFFL